MQIYTSPQADDHASTPPLSFTGRFPSCHPPTASKHWSPKRTVKNKEKKNRSRIRSPLGRQVRSLNRMISG